MGLALSGALAAAGSAGCGTEEEATAEPPVATAESGLISVWGNCPAFANDVVCVCQDIGFGGSCLLLPPSQRFFMNLSLAPLTAWNDHISSLVVGPSAKAKFCTNAGGQGTCHIQAGIGPNGFAISDLRSPPWGGNWNDQISTIRVDGLFDDCQNPSSTQIAIFDDANFNAGTAGDCVLMKAAGEYPAFDQNSSIGQTGGGYGLNTYDISSVKSGGMRYTFWDGPNFTGIHLSSTATNANLGTIGWNDRMSSMVLSSCSHDLCIAGSALTTACGDPCVAKICNVDSICCIGGWDGICASEVTSICGRSCS
jgi:hypothetical protein